MTHTTVAGLLRETRSLPPLCRPTPGSRPLPTKFDHCSPLDGPYRGSCEWRLYLSDRVESIGSSESDVGWSLESEISLCFVGCGLWAVGPLCVGSTDGATGGCGGRVCVHV